MTGLLRCFLFDQNTPILHHTEKNVQHSFSISVHPIYRKKLVCMDQRTYMLFALWVYMLLESERGRAVIYVDCRVTPGRFGYAIATLIDSTSSCFSVYVYFFLSGLKISAKEKKGVYALI